MDSESIVAVVHREPGHVVALVDHTMVVIWARNVRADDVRRMAQIGRDEPALAEEFCGLHVFCEGAGFDLDAEAREASIDLVREFHLKTTGAAAVILGDTWRRSILRSVLSGITLVARARQPTKVFASIPEAADWIAPLMHPEPTSTKRHSADIIAAAAGLAEDAMLSMETESREAVGS